MWCKLFEIRRLIFHVGDPIWRKQQLPRVSLGAVLHRKHRSLDKANNPARAPAVFRGVSNRWNGIWNGTVNVHSCSKLVLQVLSFKVELATVCLGLLSHRRGCMRKSSACCQHSSWSGITMSRSERGVPRRPAHTMHRSHTYHC